MSDKIEIVAPIMVEDVDRYKEMSAFFGIPPDGSRQLDLQYFLAVFLSSGGNLNYAYFLPTELFKAERTISLKAVDLEHMEREVIGHIYDKVFVDKTRSVINPKEWMKKDKVVEADKLELDVLIAGVVYSNRFPEVAQEIKMNKWKVSMECYFDNFDLKIGDVIIPRSEAEPLGYANMIGKPAILKYKGEEIATDMVYRVLRGIMFTGCGLVTNPANPPSVILEYASLEEKRKEASEQNNVVELENIESWLKSKQEEERLAIDHLNEKAEEKKEVSDTISWICDCCGAVVKAEQPPKICPVCNKEVTRWRSQEDEKDNPEESRVSPNAGPESLKSPGQCVNYKRYVWEQVTADGSPLANSPIVHENWCSRYDEGCTVPAGDATDNRCLRYVFKEIVMEEARRKMVSKERAAKIQSLMDEIDFYLLDLTDNAGLESSAKWTRKFINDLPNSSFAAIEPGYKDGGNKNMRHLPHHNEKGGGASNVNIDMPHLRNAFARVSHIKPAGDGISREALIKKAESHLNNHKSLLKTG